MRFTTAFAAISALVATVSAQTQDHQVMVGMNATLTFTPSSISANAGDTVTFIFNPKNHTVTQSTFAAPCTAMPNGTDSKFIPVDANVTTFPTMTITVNDTTSLWFHCSQTSPASHCGKGMVFAVNPTADKSFEAFQATANQTLSNSTSTTNSTTSSPSGSTTGSGASPSASTTTNTNSSGALTTGVRASTALAAIGFAMGLLL